MATVTPPARQLPVRVTEEQLSALDALARIDGVSMAEEIRRAIDAKIEACRVDPDFQERLRANIARSQRVFDHLRGR
jgi:hypothetical protein